VTIPARTTAGTSVQSVGVTEPHKASVRFDAPHDPKSVRGMRRALSARHVPREAGVTFNSSI